MTDYARRVRELPIPPIPRLILYALASHADADGVCWPSIRTLCDDTGLARRTVQTHLQRIIHDRLVLREARIGQASVYRLNVEVWPSTTRASARAAPMHDKPTESAVPALPMRTECAEGAHDTPTTRARPAPEVTKNFPVNFPLNLPGKLTPPVSKTETANPNPRQERLLRWWSSEAGIKLKGIELGIPARPGESYDEYKTRLMNAERGAPP